MRHVRYGTVALCRERLKQGVINPASILQDQQEDQPQAATLEECTEHAETQWQKVLLALVEGRSAPLRPHKDLPGLGIRKLFVEAGLLDEAGELAQDGFKFLFTDLYSQLWLLLKHYLEQSSQEQGTQRASALSFLLQLSFRQARHPVELREQSTANVFRCMFVVSFCSVAIEMSGTVVPHVSLLWEGVWGHRSWTTRAGSKLRLFSEFSCCAGFSACRCDGPTRRAEADWRPHRCVRGRVPLKSGRPAVSERHFHG